MDSKVPPIFNMLIVVFFKHAIQNRKSGTKSIALKMLI